MKEAIQNWLQDRKEAFQKSWQELRIGDGTAAGYWRQGLRELRQALYPESNIAQTADYGIWGAATPGEIATDRSEKKDAAVDGVAARDQEPAPRRENALTKRLKELDDRAPQQNVDQDRGQGLSQ